MRFVYITRTHNVKSSLPCFSLFQIGISGISNQVVKLYLESDDVQSRDITHALLAIGVYKRFRKVFICFVCLREYQMRFAYKRIVIASLLFLHA
jgi:hypothetical protein